MKKRTFLLLLMIVCLCISDTSFASNANDELKSNTVYITKDKSSDLKKNELIAQIINNAKENDKKARGEYDWTYRCEYGSTKYVTASGFPGGQPTRGVKFSAPGGAFYWKKSGGPEINLSVSFTFPFKTVEFSAELGNCVSSTDGEIAYIQQVDNYTDFVKLQVIITYEVEPYVIIRTNRHTGAEEVYYNGSYITEYSYEFLVREML